MALYEDAYIHDELCFRLQFYASSIDGPSDMTVNTLWTGFIFLVSVYVIRRTLYLVSKLKVSVQ